MNINIFYRGDDTTGEARLRSDWNKHIMNDVIAPLYALLLVKACTHLQTLTDHFSIQMSSLPQNPGTLQSSSELYVPSPYSILSLFPCPAPPDCWGSIPVSLFPLLADQRILYSRSNGGCYLSLRQAILLDSHSSREVAVPVPHGQGSALSRLAPL